MELATGNHRGLARVGVRPLDEVTHGLEGLHVRVLVDDHGQRAGLKILTVIIGQFVRDPGDAMLRIELLERPHDFGRAGAAVIDAGETGAAQSFGDDKGATVLIVERLELGIVADQMGDWRRSGRRDSRRCAASARSSHFLR